MQIDYGLRLETTQKLIMTPQLRQAIAILQLSSLELSAMVEDALLENPVLEVAVPENKEQDNEEETTHTEELTQAMTTNLPEEEVAAPAKAEEDRYAEWAEYFDGGRFQQAQTINENRQQRELYAVTAISLQEHLETQLSFTELSAELRRLDSYLIGCIDDNGYLCCSLEEAAATLSLPTELAEQALVLLQTFDPPGVGARSLNECLRIQIRQKEQEQPALKNPLLLPIVDDYLSWVAEGRYKAIAEQLGCTPQKVQQAVDLLRTLDPKPGRCFGGSSQVTYIIPDLTVERVNADYIITINEGYVPQLTINPYYRQVIRDADTESRKFVEGRINSAVWLLKSIEQRRRTLYNVMEAIIKIQRDFFDYGPKFLRPLTMKIIADMIEVHESTVSRAVANKYAATPHGLLSLHAFFSAGIQNKNGADVSASTIKGAIKELVNAEDARQPLSDQALKEILNKQDIAVSRRTVAKYREEMGIAASCKRKRY